MRGWQGCRSVPTPGEVSAIGIANQRAAIRQHRLAWFGYRARAGATLATLLLRLGQTDAVAQVLGALAQGVVTTQLDIRYVTCQYPLLRGPVGRRLVAAREFARAERLLLDEYVSCVRRATSDSEESRAAASDLAALYEGWGKPEESARWRARAGTD